MPRKKIVIPDEPIDALKDCEEYKRMVVWLRHQWYSCQPRGYPNAIQIQKLLEVERQAKERGWNLS